MKELYYFHSYFYILVGFKLSDIIHCDNTVVCCSSAVIVYYLYVKGSHTVCFSISFHSVNQMPMSHRTNFHGKSTKSACFSG